MAAFGGNPHETRAILADQTAETPTLSRALRSPVYRYLFIGVFVRYLGGAEWWRIDSVGKVAGEVEG